MMVVMVVVMHVRGRLAICAAQQLPPKRLEVDLTRIVSLP